MSSEEKRTDSGNNEGAENLPALVSNLSEGTSRELIPDRVFDDGRRVILLTTNDHLEYLAKAPQILGDGTLAHDSRHSS